MAVMAVKPATKQNNGILACTESLFCIQLRTFLLFVLERYTPGNEVSSSTALFSNYLPHLVMAVGALKRRLQERQIKHIKFAL